MRQTLEEDMMGKRSKKSRGMIRKMRVPRRRMPAQNVYRRCHFDASCKKILFCLFFNLLAGHYYCASGELVIKNFMIIIIIEELCVKEMSPWPFLYKA